MAGNNEMFDENEITDMNYQDMLEYAEELSDEIMEFLPKSIKEDRVALASWISEHEPNYDPEDKDA